MSEAFASYHQLIARLDKLCKGITAALGDALTCSAGCSSCCQAISVFPVEAAAMLAGIMTLPADEQLKIQQALASPQGGSCALLHHDLCLVYRFRPVICRTHGVPLLVQEPGQATTVAVCPLNCTGMQSFPKETMLDLARINQLLVAINLMFVKHDERHWPERVALADLGAYLCKLSP